MSKLAIPGTAWRLLLGIDPRKLSEARLQAHQAVQWLGRSARAYLQVLPDDGHTNLAWDDALDGFVTHPTQNGTRLRLSVANLTLHLDDGKVAPGFSLDGRNDRQAREWLGKRLAARNPVAKALDAPIPYALPARSLGQEASYDVAGLADALSEPAAWFANAGLAWPCQAARIGPQARCFWRAMLASPFRYRDIDLISDARGLKALTVSRRGLLRRALFLPLSFLRAGSSDAAFAAETWHIHEFMAASRQRIDPGDGSGSAYDAFLKAAVYRTFEILR